MSLGEDAHRFAALLRRLDEESLELVQAAVNRLKRDQDGSFTRELEDLYEQRFRTEPQRYRALSRLIVDKS